MVAALASEPAAAEATTLPFEVFRTQFEWAWIDLASAALLSAAEAPRSERPVFDGALYLGPQGRVSLPTKAVWDGVAERARPERAPLLRLDAERFLALEQALTTARLEGGEGADLGAALLAGGVGQRFLPGAVWPSGWPER